MRPARAWIVAGVALILSAAATPARAQCSIWSVTDVTFGTYDVFAPAPLDSVGRVIVRCSTPHWVRIELSRGLAPTFNPRTMGDGAARLNYNLYLDAARSVVWGDGTGGTDVFRDHGRSPSAFIYGRVPPLQDAAIGAYSDQITLVIQF